MFFGNCGLAVSTIHHDNPVAHVCTHDKPLENKVITTIVIRLLDDHTYCIRSTFIHLGLWQKLYDCSRHKVRARKCLIKRVLLTTPPHQPVWGSWRRRGRGQVHSIVSRPPHRFLLAPIDTYGLVYLLPFLS